MFSPQCDTPNVITTGQKYKNTLNYNSVQLNLPPYQTPFVFNRQERAVWRTVVERSDICITDRCHTSKRLNPRRHNTAVHNCTILHNAQNIIGVWMYICEQLLLCVYFILSRSSPSVTLNINSRGNAVGRSGARILKRTRDSFRKLHKHSRTHTATYWTDTCFGGGKAAGSWRRPPLHLASTLRRSGAVNLIPTHAFMVFCRDNCTVSYLYLQP